MPVNFDAVKDHEEVFDDSRLPCDGNDKFVFVTHPRSWEFHQKHGWIPRLKRIILTPGVNGCRAGKHGAAAALVAAEAEGFTRIPVTAPVLVRNEDGKLEEEEGYRVRFDAKGRKAGSTAPYYAEVWATPSVIGDGSTASVVWDHDIDARAATAKLWVERGLVPAAQPGALALTIQIQRNRAGRHVHGAHDGAPPSPEAGRSRPGAPPGHGAGSRQAGAQEGPPLPCTPAQVHRRRGRRMSTEHPNGRKAIDNMIRREIESAQRGGRQPNPEAARKQATEAAKRHDRRNGR